MGGGNGLRIVELITKDDPMTEVQKTRERIGERV